jgi:cytochrome c-type biogenesis protein CcmF
MYPARWFFFGKEEEPTTEVALRRTLAEDLYVVLGGYDAAAQSADLQVSINPLVNWIWFGVGVIVIGAVVTLLPERALAFATSRVPEGAVTTSLILLLVLSGGAAHVRAQHTETAQTEAIVPNTPLERELFGQIVCMCGGCGRKLIGECLACSTSAKMRARVTALVAEGRDRESIIQQFVTDWGSQEVLAAPINRGFNRLAWLLPYAGGLVGIGFVAGIAIRWTRRRMDPAAMPPATSIPADPELEGRLDDELRELD